jgi:hypothetical protein
MTSILQQLQPWLDSWLPPFLLGGLKHRDAREAHELLHHDIFQALQTHRKFFGAKLDIRKCFDSVSPLQAIHVWDHLQAPTEVTGLLRFFYSFSPDVLSLKKFVQLRNSLVLQASYRDVRRRLLCWLVS